MIECTHQCELTCEQSRRVATDLLEAMTREYFNVLLLEAIDLRLPLAFYLQNYTRHSQEATSGLKLTHDLISSGNMPPLGRRRPAGGPLPYDIRCTYQVNLCMSRDCIRAFFYNDMCSFSKTVYLKLACMQVHLTRFQ